MNLELDDLFSIAEAGAPDGVFDKAEADLRSQKQDALADKLLKIQQDTGEMINREMSPDDYVDGSPAPGPESALIRKNYEPVTRERLSLLEEVASQVKDTGIKKDLGSFIASLAAMLPPTIQKPSGIEPKNVR